jgi:2-polyprenyl-3-methyl-5-hydroxy-6-metoxy-1,4-benzoquinol methylase
MAAVRHANERFSIAAVEEAPDRTGDMEDCACGNCGTSSSSVMFQAADRLHNLPGSFTVVRCDHCGLMRTNPRPTRRAIRSFYPDDYGPYLQTARENQSRMRSILRRICDPLDTAIPAVPKGRLLEIGAASGNYLVQMQRQGWDVTGIEVDEASAQRAADRTRARILRGDAGTTTLDHAQFDLICAWMVFEHLHDPMAAFERCWGWLKPGGWLAFSVPDCGNWQLRTFQANWFALQVPTHLYHFTPPLLRGILERIGYHQITIRWQRTLIDVAISLALVVENVFGESIGRPARRIANSVTARAVSRALGIAAAPLQLTGRLTIWAQKPAA